MTKEKDDDVWIANRSPICSKKLHALGVVNFHWNIVEQLFRVILCNIRSNSSGVYIKASNTQISKIEKMHLTEVMANIKIEIRNLKNTPNSIEYIDNIILAADICRRNRNGLVHYFVDGYYNPSNEMKLVKDFFRRKKNFPDSLLRIRQVAEETENLWMIMSEMLGHLTLLWGYRIDQLNKPIPTPTDLFSKEALSSL